MGSPLTIGLGLTLLGSGLILHPPLLRLCAGFLIGEARPALFRRYLALSLTLTGTTLLALGAFLLARFILGVAPGDEGPAIAAAFHHFFSHIPDRGVTN